MSNLDSTQRTLSNGLHVESRFRGWLMRKEVEALQQARVLFAARSELTEPSPYT